MKDIIILFAVFDVFTAVTDPSPIRTLMAGITVATACFFHAFTLMIRNRSNEDQEANASSD